MINVTRLAKNVIAKTGFVGASLVVKMDYSTFVKKFEKIGA